MLNDQKIFTDTKYAYYITLFTVDL